MAKRMLIDAAHPEETRVAVLDGNRVEDFDFETQNRKQLRGNIYLAKVTRVEPSLQAAFVEYGGNRHGFLAFPEIHPDYYAIPTRRSGIDQGRARRRRSRSHWRRRGRGRHRRASPPHPHPSLQNPRSHPPPPDHADPGGQGRTRQQGRGAHDLSLAGGPLLRADAQYRSRRGHIAQDHPGHRSQAVEEDRRGPRCAAGPGPDHPHRRRQTHQDRDQARL